MRFYKLMLNTDSEYDMVVKGINLVNIKRNDVNVGKPITNWNNEIRFVYEKDLTATDYLANNLGWFIVSNRMLSVIKSLGCHFEKFELSITKEAEPAKELVGYSLLNVLDVVDALSLDDSDYSVYEVRDKQVFSFRKHAIRQDLARGKHIFKLLGDEGPIFVSEEFKKIVLESRLSGCDFLEVKVV